MADHSVIGVTVDKLSFRAEALGRLLRRRRLSLVTAESCTAGLAAHLMAQTEQATSFLVGGFVVYTKAAKAKVLGVPRSLMDQPIGAVSAEVANAMAIGALARSGADVCVAITGVAGPEPDEDGNGVGLFYVSCGESGRAPNYLRLDFGSGERDVLIRYVLASAFRLASMTLDNDDRQYLAAGYGR
jgi:nicotinamide-nucleotide amidase